MKLLLTDQTRALKHTTFFSMQVHVSMYICVNVSMRVLVWCTCARVLL